MQTILDSADQPAHDAFVEKKSEFIGYAARVETEEAAKSFIERIRRKHSDATYYCYAYLLKDSGLSRLPHVGESGGTASESASCRLCCGVRRFRRSFGRTHER